MNEVKTAIESTENRLDETEKEFVNLKTDHLKLSILKRKKKRMKGQKKASRTYGTSLKETIYASLESQKEKRKKFI